MGNAVLNVINLFKLIFNVKYELTWRLIVVICNISAFDKQCPSYVYFVNTK